MTSIWQHIDEEIAATPMPEEYQNKLVIIPHPLPCENLIYLSTFAAVIGIDKSG
jgi:hypothetical protein